MAIIKQTQVEISVRHRPQVSVNIYCPQSTVIQLFQSKEMLGLNICRKKHPNFILVIQSKGLNYFFLNIHPNMILFKKSEESKKKKTNFKSIEKTETLFIMLQLNYELKSFHYYATQLGPTGKILARIRVVQIQFLISNT